MGGYKFLNDFGSDISAVRFSSWSQRVIFLSGIFLLKLRSYILLCIHTFTTHMCICICIYIHKSYIYLHMYIYVYILWLGLGI